MPLEAWDWQLARLPKVSLQDRFAPLRADWVVVIGCKVIATASTEEKRRVAKEKGGVDEVVDYSKPDWQVSYESDKSHFHVFRFIMPCEWCN